MSISPPATSPETSSTGSLLHRYVRGDVAAFRDLTRRYYPLVFAAALRRSGGQHALAEDAAQIVFIDLAKRAPGLRADERLGGWLHQRALRAARDLMRGEQRRRERETAAAFADPETFSLNAPSAPDKEHEAWKDLAPFVDEALQRLSGRDRDAVLLRCVEGRDFRAVGRALGLSDDAAQKRVSRALEKLRVLLARRGVAPAAAAAALGSGLLADASAAATLPALSGKATLAASAALTKAGAISTAARWLPQIKAAAAGSALACAAWAWPLAKEYHDEKSRLSPSPATAISPVSGKAAPVIHYPVFPALPKKEPGLSVEEIVIRIGVLAGGPWTSDASDRFHFFLEELRKDSRVGEAARLLARALSPDLLSAMDQRRWRTEMISLWAETEPYAALTHAVTALAPLQPGERPSVMTETISQVLQKIMGKNDPDPLALSRWFAGTLLHSPAFGRDWTGKNDLAGIARRIIEPAMKQESREALVVLCGVENTERLGLLSSMPSWAQDQSGLELLRSIVPELSTPALRAELLRQVMRRHTVLDPEGARRYVEDMTDPQQRLEYARLVAGPSPVIQPGASSPAAQEDLKPKADWWLSLSPARQHDETAVKIADAWRWIDPEWGDAWLQRQLSPDAFVEALLQRFSGIIRTSMLENSQAQLTVLAYRLRELDPAKTEAAFAALSKELEFRADGEKLKKFLHP